MRKAIFFDRDGILNKSIVINAKPYSPRSLKEFKINLFLRKYINFFKKKNFMIIVITNQPDVGAGKVPKNLILYFLWAKAHLPEKSYFFFNEIKKGRRQIPISIANPILLFGIKYFFKSFISSFPCIITKFLNLDKATYTDFVINLRFYCFFITDYF